MHGAMIKTVTSLAPIGSSLNLCISVEFEHSPMELVLSAKICHNNRAVDADFYFIGMVFTGLGVQDKLVLHYLTHATSNTD